MPDDPGWLPGRPPRRAPESRNDCVRRDERGYQHFEQERYQLEEHRSGATRSNLAVASQRYRDFFQRLLRSDGWYASRGLQA